MLCRYAVLQWCRRKTVRGGGGCVVENILNTPLAKFIIEFMKLISLLQLDICERLKEEAIQHTVVALFFHWLELTFLFFSFGKCIVENFYSLTYGR